MRKALAMAFAIGLAIGAVTYTLWPERIRARSANELMDVLMWNREPVGGPFALTDHNGGSRSDKDFRGQLMLVYFGFTYCADVCPIDMQTIAQAVDLMGPDSMRVQPLFITISPETDSPEQLKRYVALFHPRAIGLTGSRQQIAKIANNFKVYFAKSEPQKRSSTSVDHSSHTYVIGTHGEYLGFFPSGTAPQRMADFLVRQVGTALHQEARDLR